MSDDMVTIMEDYYKDDTGVWYRWKLPTEERWHLKLTPYTELPYIRYKHLTKAEYEQYYRKPYETGDRD